MDNNFYDKVNETVTSLKQRDEYKKYIELKEEIRKDSDLVNQVKNFKMEQMELQKNMMITGNMDDKGKEALQLKYEELIKNEKVREYFELEIRLDILLADMQKIIADGLKELYDI